MRGFCSLVNNFWIILFKRKKKIKWVTIYTFMAFSVLYTRVKSVRKAHDDKNQGLSRWGAHCCKYKKKKKNCMWWAVLIFWGACHK